jgi:hypothetical protein
VIRPYASAAFANGWAEVDGAPTTWPAAVHVEHATACAVAESQQDSARVLEAVRRTGRLWALYHANDARKDALEARFAEKLHPLVRQLGRIAAPLIAARLRHPQEAIGDISQPQAQSIAQTTLESLIGEEAYQAWLQLTSDALLEGTADGIAGAELFLASLKGAVLPSFDLEFQAALDRLARLSGVWDDPAVWMGRQIHGLAYQMGGELADAIANGASYDELIAIIEGATRGETNADLMLNHAISTASSQGALDLYRSEGVQYINVLTSPGACVEYCEPLDAENPFDIADDPGLPMHPNCRCAYSPTFSNPADFEANLS